MRLLGEILRGGFTKVGRNLHFILLFWIVNFAFASLLSITLYKLLDSSLAYSAAGDSMLQQFDFRWYQEFIHHSMATLNLFPPMLIIAALIYLMIQTFFHGGLLAVLNSPERKTLFIDFFYGGVQYFTRFFRILIVALLTYSAIFLLNGWLADLLNVVMRDTVSESGRIAVSVVRMSLLGAALLLSTVLFDFTRVAIIVDAERRVVRHMVLTALFLWHQTKIVVLVFITVIIMTVIFFMLSRWIDSFFMPSVSFGMIFLVFLFQQIYIISRIWLRMLFTASELTLYHECTAEEVVLSVEEDRVYT